MLKSTINKIDEKFFFCYMKKHVNYEYFPKKMKWKKGLFFIKNIQNENNVFLAIYGANIEIIKPKNFPFSYYNRHGYFSLNFVLVVDYKIGIRSAIYCFGSSHDLIVF